MTLNSLLSKSHANYMEFFDEMHQPMFNGYITRMDVLTTVYQNPAFGRTEVESMPDSTYFTEKIIIKSWESVGIKSLVEGMFAF